MNGRMLTVWTSSMKTSLINALYRHFHPFSCLPEPWIVEAADNNSVVSLSLSLDGFAFSIVYGKVFMEIVLKVQCFYIESLSH